MHPYETSRKTNHSYQKGREEQTRGIEVNIETIKAFSAPSVD